MFIIIIQGYITVLGAAARNICSYITLNLVILVMNYFAKKEFLQAQRFMAAISAICLWLKLFDWLRLFGETAFYIRLIYLTLDNIRAFSVIIFIMLMMFGSAVHIINLG